MKAVKGLWLIAWVTKLRRVWIQGSGFKFEAVNAETDLHASVAAQVIRPTHTRIYAQFPFQNMIKFKA